MATRRQPKHEREEINLSQIEKYIEDCEQLQQDLRHVREDILFVQEGGTIYYAADFSEIYAYALPIQTAEEISLFVDESIEIATALQDRALEHLFFGSDEILLLPPYGIELQAFVRAEHEGLIEKEVRLYVEFINELKQALQSTKYRQLRELVTERGKAQDISSDIKANLLRFLERHLKTFLRLLEPPNLGPLELLKRLFENKRFVSLDTFDGVEEYYDEETIDKWYDALRKEHFVPASYLDARSMAITEGVNHFFRAKKEKAQLLLTTRSSNMHKAIRRLQIERGNETAAQDISFLRHTRTFHILPTVLKEKDPFRELSSREDLITVFLQAAESREKARKRVGVRADEFEHHNDPLLRQLLSQIKTKWSSLIAITTGRNIERSDPRDADALVLERLGVETVEEVMRIMQLLTDPDGLKDLVDTRISELRRMIERQNDLLGLSLFTDIEDPTIRVYGQNLENRLLLESSIQALPYAIHFYSDWALQQLQNFKAGKTYSWQDVFELLDDSLFQWDNTSSEYEGRLVMACNLGAFNQWELAMHYVKRALDAVEKDDTESPHEGVFFLALCMRKIKVDSRIESLREAQKFIDRAIELRIESGHRPEGRDPRYLREKGLQILIMNAVSTVDEEVPSVEDGLSLLKEAEDILLRETEEIETKRLLIQIHSARLYFFVETGRWRAHQDLIRHHYDWILEQQKILEPDERKWTAFTLDTLAWTRWIAFNQSTEEEIKKIRVWLRFAKNGPGLTIDDAEIISRHIEAVHLGRREPLYPSP